MGNYSEIDVEKAAVSMNAQAVKDHHPQDKPCGVIGTGRTHKYAYGPKGTSVVVYRKG